MFLKNIVRLIPICITFILLFTNAAFADTGIPFVAMIANFIAGGSLLFIIPVVFIESLVIWLLLSKPVGDGYKKALLQSLIINAITTVIGFAGGFLFGLTSYMRISEAISRIITILVISFVITVAIEIYILSKCYKNNPATTKTGILMNIPSYIFLFLIFAFFINLKDFGYDNPVVQMRENMHSFQTMIETYAIDSGGIYPNDFESLRKEAIKMDYLTVGENPCIKKVTYMDILFNKFKLESIVRITKNKEKSNPCSIEYTPFKDKKGAITSYEIRGYDTKGNIVKAYGKENFLTNR